MMRRASSHVLLAAAAIAASSCHSSGVPALDIASLGAAPGHALVVLNEDDAMCSVIGERAKLTVIDSFDGGENPREITWTRLGTWDPQITFHLLNARDRRIFPGFEGSMARRQLQRPSGRPALEDADWTADSDGDPYSYTFRYEVRSRGKVCDPEICIRKSGSGCSG